MRSLLITLFLLLLASCAGTNFQTQVAHDWQGKRADTLLQRWGTPDLQITTANGDKLYSYVTNSYQSYTNPVMPPYTISAPRGGKPVLASVSTENNSGLAQLKCETSFEINKEDRIVSVKIEGNNCLEDPKFRKRISNTAPN